NLHERSRARNRLARDGRFRPDRTPIEWLPTSKSKANMRARMGGGGSFGRYRIGPRVGSGGMAVVDAAHLPSPNGGRTVALKRISSAHAHDSTARKLFLREASIVTRIEHPNVVRTYDVGEIEGQIYIAMELLEGATLATLVRDCDWQIPLSIAIAIVCDGLRGLHAAHELRGQDGALLDLVHQDISPQNVHTAYEGTTRILDFGVARLGALDP